MENGKEYDITVVGGGPAGFTAALYSARAGRTVLLIEKGAPGGQMGITSLIENYPGVEPTDGFSLAVKMEEQAKRAGAEILHGEVTALSLDGTAKTVTVGEKTVKTRAVIVATGAKPRLLGVGGEKEYTSRGVSYCATCDGMFFRKKSVVVCGGGETAFEDALYLSNICEKVTLVHRRDSFRASEYTVGQAKKKDNIVFVTSATVSEIVGEGGRVNGVKISYSDGREESLPCAGVFVAVGRVPETALFVGQLDCDGGGYIIAGEDCLTSAYGVFAAGDVRTKSVRQIVTAAADGAVAAHSAEEYLQKTT